MIKLCYKEYDWKMSNGACKKFAEKTGMDLQYFFGDYIEACMKMDKGESLFCQMQAYAKLHSRENASFALYCIISEANKSVPAEEIYDATYRVSWVLSDRPDDLSEPWPFVMLATALEINNYFNENTPKKKETDT